MKISFGVITGSDFMIQFPVQNVVRMDSAAFKVTRAFGHVGDIDGDARFFCQSRGFVLISLPAGMASAPSDGLCRFFVT